MSEEFTIQPRDNYKRSIYLVKELIKEKKTLTLNSSTFGAPLAVRVSETLRRLNYVTIENYMTETKVVNNKRRTSIIITLAKTSKFEKLYEENQERRKQFIEEREKSKVVTTTETSK